MFNKKVVSGIIAASLFVAVPASAQLLGGGITGSGAGALGAQMGRMDAGGALSTAGQGSLGADDSLGGARSGLGRLGNTARERSANGAAAGKSGAQASKGQLAGAADASQTLSGKVADSTQSTGESAGNAAAEKPQPGLLDSATAGAGGSGAFEREAGGRRVKAHGRSENQVSRDASGLGLASANDAGASLEKVEPAAAEQPAEAEQK